jgi:hypothetical protein
LKSGIACISPLLAILHIQHHGLTFFKLFLGQGASIGMGKLGRGIAPQSVRKGAHYALAQIDALTLKTGHIAVALGSVVGRPTTG